MPARTDYAAVVAALDPFIRHEMAGKEIPGLSIALVEGAEIVWGAGYGFANPADSTPATAETVYRAGSLAKVVTSIAVMQLVESGAVDLDAAVSRYLPDFNPVNRFPSQVTIRHLLSHRSGLVREPPQGSYYDSARVALADAVRSLSATELVYEPGKRTKYSDAGMAVLGAVVEQVRGQPFALVAQGMFSQLGMTHSTFTPDFSIDRAVAQGFLWSIDNRTSPAPRFEMGLPPAAGLYTTAIDLAKLGAVLLNGGEGGRGSLVAAETIAAMWRVGAADSGRGREWGLGFRVSDLDGARRVGHAAAFGGFSTELSLLPSDGLGVVVIITKDGANAITGHVAGVALGLMRDAKRGRPVTPVPLTTALKPEIARRLEGRWGRAGVSVEMEHRNGRVFYHPANGENWVEIRALGDTLVTDDRGSWGERFAFAGNRLVVGRDTLAPVSQSRPRAATEKWRGLVGEYGTDFNIVYAREDAGQLHLLVNALFDYPLTFEAGDTWRFPDRGLYAGERVQFTPGSVIVGGVTLPRRSIAPEDGSTFKIVPLRPAEELVAEALAATPPVETDPKLPGDLVELTRLDPTIKLDIRYATTNNFVSTAFYSEARAFMQRPAAQALVAAHRRLKTQGYGLLIHDAYRPWYVTKMFWDATPADKKVFVANPANGSRHNRGCAVDLTLYDLRTGKPIEMVSGYDEFSDRAYPDYPGGTALQRWHRRLLRDAMEAQGFTVYSAEWWHFDYRDWRKYPILNQRFEEIGARAARQSSQGGVK